MLLIKNIKIKVDIENQNEEIINKVNKILKTKINNFEINKLSIDARDKKDIYYVYEIKLNIDNENKYVNYKDVEIYNEEKLIIPNVKNKDNKVYIIGAGPAGLFCAYTLAKSGLKPVIFERGEKIEDRVKTVENFWENNILNKESNVQFGEGGAGTFSDGKLNTMIKEKVRQKFVFETFVNCGAPKEILYLNKPHIGTDLLRNIIINLRNEIIGLGGKIYYNSKLTNIITENNNIKKIIINDKDEYEVDNLVLALGHSARDTFTMLNNHLDIIPKAFAVGIRVEHKQDMINKNQYKDYCKYLPSADYKLTYQSSDGRGVYSFCMCPGGFVVNSSSEENRLCINGMSNHSRDEENANSAIVVTVSPSDYGNNIFDGLNFQRALEEKAYKIGNGLIPISSLYGYINNKVDDNIINPVFKGNYTFANINDVFPEYINKALKESFIDFNKKIKGFNNPDTIIAAVEARTSSPIRIVRDENLESNIKGIYPCGEGAGYAGGITSASIDGIKIAEKIINHLL